ncbi:protoporphyrinogen/coproporphyrinogen oxidase [Lacinutrix jangbogonensis]|uniref:protoporphyrinogen/coproporphyrinogen oxidase n=1 Tax=Lacinutrix jangbogonensis TaxID=1469557 RepID=UPI00053E8401|nr:FAD-dependent oxidoreductase [Lacinutrix jangbogonensis]
MSKNSKNIYIIGAGISGLITALELEKAGFSPTIIEASASVGGRVKTETINGYVLDRGFQVLLESYPKAIKHLDYTDLDLQELVPGAVIYSNGKQQTIGDPLRNLALLLPTLTSNVGSIKDKLSIYKLNLALKKKTIDAIFNDKNNTTTLEYLKTKGFSDTIINHFFRPFFAGIFLETELQTPSKLFEFIYKMFGEGLAVIPKDGIQAIPNQLKAKLKNTTFLFNSPVNKVEEKRIILNDGTVIESDITVIATESAKLLHTNTTIDWKSCDTLYFTVENDTLKKPIIGLLADASSIINNIFFTTSIKNNNTNKDAVLSVTIVKSHDLTEKELIKKVTLELDTICSIKTKQFIKRYQIKRALPNLKSVKYATDGKALKHSETIYLAGDHTLNGSLNAAMTSGEDVVKQIVSKFN